MKIKKMLLNLHRQTRKHRHMPRQERVYRSIDRCLLRNYTEIMNKEKMITEPSPDHLELNLPEREKDLNHDE